MGARLSIQKNGHSEVTHENLSSHFRSEISPTSGIQTQADNEILKSSNLKNFRLAVLQAATKNFSQDLKESLAAYSRDVLIFDKQSLTASTPESGMPIAVKQFHNHEEFSTEVKYLALLDHPNLVKPIGYCLDGDRPHLVFEFMAHGSLEDHLFKRNSSFKPLSWNNRMKIALDAANGLALLHSGEVNVIFRDFKSSRIVLDADYNAKLYGLGLARNGHTREENHVSTRVIGTVGYIANEYLATGHLTTKCDVYAFGVVLLEMLTRRRVSDVVRTAKGFTSLADWAAPYMRKKGKLLTIMDDEIEGQYLISEAHKVGNLALQCLSKDPKLRPGMPQVVGTLEKLQTESNASSSSTCGTQGSTD